MERFEIARVLDLQLAVLRSQRSILLQGATELERSVIATIVSELGSNILKYARSGTVEIRRVRRGTLAEVEITAHDAGPGIADVELALQDHYSSGRTLGLGLPGVRRMADAFEIGPTEGGGTTVRACKRLLGPNVLDRPATARATGHRVAGDAWRAAACVRPRAGQVVGGDAAVIVDRGDHVLLAIIDVTGHGPSAHALASDLVERLRERFEATPDPDDVIALLQALHQACSGTVGAAAGLAVLDVHSGRARYLAVGNVRAAVLGGERFTGVSRDGLLGRHWPTPFVQHTALRSGDLVLLWTDGLPESLATLAARHDGRELLVHPEEAVIADGLVDGFGKRHDDAACLVARWRP